MQVTLVSLMAPNADSFHHEVGRYLAAKTGLDITWLDDASWSRREQSLEQNAATVAFVCGGQYVQQLVGGMPRELLGAPVMLTPRYAERPVYFSDWVVRARAPFQTFADLAGARWAYNEQGSFSGFRLVCSELAARGLGLDYFGSVVASGSHQRSLRMVLDREADVTAVDSVVLEREQALHPEMRDELRVIDSFGPSPIPPVVCSRTVSPRIRGALRDALLTMHHDPHGERTLREGAVARFVPVADTTYDPIRAHLARGRALACSCYSHTL